MNLSAEQERALGSLRHGIEARMLQEEPVCISEAYDSLPEDWRDQEPSDAKCRLLLAFFKNQFFTWVNAPSCLVCHSAERMKAIGVRGPQTEEEYTGLASRVEVYSCEACNGTVTPFPRFNHPLALLKHRKGRCGEWANCFATMAIASRFETRFVLDLTDHVWAEVFSPDQQRWIHCDPCENVFDGPLMYESGWNKKLSWVFAFESGGCALDVTRRYSRSFDVDMIKRRLNFHSLMLTRALQNNAPHVRPSEYDEFKRCSQETLGKLMSKTGSQDANLKPEETRGRISGDTKWKESRGEAGNDRVRFRERVAGLVAQGMSPTQAAAQALKDMAQRKEQ